MSDICIGLDLFGCFRIEEMRDNDNATGLKEGREIEIEKLQLLFIYAIAHALSFA